LPGKHWKGVKDKMARGVGAMPYSPNFRPPASEWSSGAVEGMIDGSEMPRVPNQLGFVVKPRKIMG